MQGGMQPHMHGQMQPRTDYQDFNQPFAAPASADAMHFQQHAPAMPSAEAMQMPAMPSAAAMATAATAAAGFMANQGSGAPGMGAVEQLAMDAATNAASNAAQGYLQN